MTWLDDNKHRITFEWWSSDTGSVQVDGTDIVNVTIGRREFSHDLDCIDLNNTGVPCGELCDTRHDPHLTDEQYEEIEDAIVQSIASRVTNRED